MELTLENLGNEIVKQESEYRLLMIRAGEIYGKTNEETKFWGSKWSALYTLAKDFGFIDKLKR